ncbi:TPA: site-specific integrase [Pseudomonas putida]|nr:site-specific integrase [Pseudomonas putida]
MIKQLFVIYESAKIPARADPNYNTSEFHAKNRIIRHLALMRWPNGRPCHLANQWLYQKSINTKAKDSSRALASELTHLIRYCYVKNIPICKFNDKNFEDFTRTLTNESTATKTGIKIKRNNNRTRKIQHTTLNFLHWLSNNICNLTDFPLVGEENSGANIIIKTKANPKTGTLYLDHPDLVTTVDEEDDKAPIDEHTIQKLQDEIFRRHDWEELPPGSTLKHKHDPELYIATNLYIYQRRMFIIRMMKLMGMRPEELYDLDLKHNSKVSENKEIVAPTKKRGAPPPKRHFKVNAPSARQFDAYLDARKSYLEFLESRGMRCVQPDKILIGAYGSRIKKESITKEFDRICEGAGLTSIRVCLSMFRHRFVTREINIRLELRFAKYPELKNGWTAGLRDEVCREVMALTGHARPESLHHYFHSEYTAITSDASYSSMLELKDEIDSSNEAIVTLEHKAKIAKIDCSVEIAALKSTVARLQSLLSKLGVA